MRSTPVVDDKRATVQAHDQADVQALALSQAARGRFGWSTLHDYQLAAMRAVMEGRDALVIAPTGGGKSGVYQVPATLLAGPTIVVSPLLALQQGRPAASAEP